MIMDFKETLRDEKSQDFKDLSDKVTRDVGRVYRAQYPANFVRVVVRRFSNSDDWIQTKVEYQFSTPIIVNPSKIIDGILASTSPVRYVRYTLKVNENQAQFDMVLFSLRILNKDFSNGLSNRGSTEFKELSTQVTTSIKKLFGNEKGFSEVYVTKLTKGSVVASTEVTFSPGPTSPSRVSQILLNGVPSLETEGLKIDSTSINPPAPPTPRPFPGFAVAIIVLCGLAILIIPILIIVALKTGLFRKLAQAFSLRSPDYYDF
ncbi:Taste receptor cell protein 1 [Acipenser ruthenus]|uniref:Taste receptor cell protein 1 n=1 Tax=Acipenser ruthenus TaxID=7906 RepID=A0A444UFJ7_ACIRT|nr:Taste receptor cell protein 1 [Acipenser ruthenus]